MLLKLVLVAPGALAVALWLLANLAGASERTLGMVDAVAVMGVFWALLALLPMDGAGRTVADAPDEPDAGSGLALVLVRASATGVVRVVRVERAQLTAGTDGGATLQVVRTERAQVKGGN